MASVSLNPVFNRMSGKLGDLVFKRYGKGTILARRPDFASREFSAAQKAVQDRFRQAAAYGKATLGNAQARAPYDAASERDGQPVMSLMVRDYLTAPVVDDIDLQEYTKSTGDRILVRATDDFEVTGVSVEIADGNGTVFESGQATFSAADGARWVYNATVNVPANTTVQVKATATDRPAHTGTKTVSK